MSKPFQITNAMRDKVADELTAQAVAKSAPAIAKQLKAMNTMFWGEHIARVENLPGLDRACWSSLIQEGVVTAVSTCFPTTPVLEGERYYSREFLGFYYYDRDERAKSLFQMILGSPAYSGVADFIQKNERSRSSWGLRFKSESGSVPRTHSLGAIPNDHEIVKTGRAIQSELNKVLSGAAAFRSQVMDVLTAYRSSRQVEELFPEAALLLPQPIRNENALAPVDLIASVREMLVKGVPPVSANA